RCSEPGEAKRMNRQDAKIAKDGEEREEREERITIGADRKAKMAPVVPGKDSLFCLFFSSLSLALLASWRFILFAASAASGVLAEVGQRGQMSDDETDRLIRFLLAQ